MATILTFCPLAGKVAPSPSFIVSMSTPMLLLKMRNLVVGLENVNLVFVEEEEERERDKSKQSRIFQG